MEEAPENGKESSHSAHANGMNESVNETMIPGWSILYPSHYTDCPVTTVKAEVR